MPELRDYQARAVDALRGSYAARHRAPLLVLPTGGGKTVIFSEITRRAANKGTTALVVVHRRELVRQASAKLADAGVAHGIIAAGTPPTPGAQVQVASIQTVVQRLDRLGSVALAIFDEGHHAVAATWQRLLDAIPQAKCLGVTATPLRLDGKGLGVDHGGPFDDLVLGASVAELIAGGWLVPSRVFVAKTKLNLQGIATVAGDYAKGQLGAAVMAAGLAGDAVTEYRRRADHQPAIAFTVTVDHAEATAKAFRAAGYRSAAVHGNMAVAERDALVAGLANGEVEVLASCEILGEGVDIPRIGAAILLRPTKSLALYLQQVGRGLRPHEGKSHLTVLDLAANAIAHGLPEERHAWSLAGRPQRLTEPAQAPCWCCKACDCLNPTAAMVCLDCNAPRPPGRRELTIDPTAELVQLRERQRLQRICALPYRQFLAERRTWEELEAYRRARGYKPGWVKHVWQEMTAHRPSAERSGGEEVRP